jgi:hypothetical protein
MGGWQIVTVLKWSFLGGEYLRSHEFVSPPASYLQLGYLYGWIY